MSYYWFNKEKLLKNAQNKCHTEGGKQKSCQILQEKCRHDKI